VGSQRRVQGTELAVDRHPYRQAREQLVKRRPPPKLRERVGHGRTLGQLGFDPVDPGALAQLGEQAYASKHLSSLPGGAREVGEGC